MSRFFTIGNAKRIAHRLVEKSHERSVYSGEKQGLLFRVGICPSRCRYNSQYTSSARGYASFAGYRVQNDLYNNSQKIPAATSSSKFKSKLLSSLYKGRPFTSRGYATCTGYRTRNGLYDNFHKLLSSATSSTNPRSHHARFLLSYLCKGRTFFQPSRIARAAGLALSCSFVVVPSIFALTCRKNVAMAEAMPAKDLPSPRNAYYLHTQVGYRRASFTGILLSVFEGASLLVRAFYLAILFFPSIAMAPFVDVLGPHFRKKWLQVVHRTLERAGPMFIKWGQWAAERPDLFPRDLCAELSKLQSEAPEHDLAFTEKTIKEAFGRNVTEIFDEFKETPRASGSIAQVYRARYSGQDNKSKVVAVKVLHPGVAKSIKRDLKVMKIAAKISRFIPSLNWLRLDESVHQFSEFMLLQVDLAREAANLTRFNYNFRGWRNVSFPQPIYPLVHPSVLVETYEEGESVTHYVNELEGNERLKSDLAHIGTIAYIKMLVYDNYMHGDMHQGNILVRAPLQKSSWKRRLFKSGKPHMVILDAGMTNELSQKNKTNLYEFFKAVTHRDGQTAAECILNLSEKQTCPNPNAFIKEVKESIDFWGSSAGDSVHPGDCMMQLFEQIRRHKVNIDASVCTAMVTTSVLEGWQRKLDPNYNMMHTLQSLILQADWAVRAEDVLLELY